MKYSLDYSRTIYYTVEVEADTLEEAESLAEDAIDSEESEYEDSRDSLVLEDYTEIED
jgi:hypothetical protein